MGLISVESVEKSFGSTKVLRGPSFGLERGEQVVIQGASGSGKSTLLYLLGGLDRPDSGRILFDGQDLGKISDGQLAAIRNRKIGLVFQYHFLLSSLTGEENALLPARIGNQSLGEVKKRVHNYCEILGIQHCLQKYPYQLSGGEQQRVNLVRALSLHPQLLLCDEPTGNLDSINSNKVLHLLQGLAHEIGATLFLVTHDSNLADHFHRKIVIEDGQIIG